MNRDEKTKAPIDQSLNNRTRRKQQQQQLELESKFSFYFLYSIAIVPIPLVADMSLLPVVANVHLLVSVQ